MKKIKSIGLGALVASCAIVSGIERPAGEVKEKKSAPLVQPQGGILGGEEGKAQKQEAVEVVPIERKVAYLGVGGEEAGEALLSHLGVTSGLLVNTIDPQSGAFQILRIHDVIHSLDSKPVADQESLRDILSEYEPEQEVALGIVRAGKQQVIKTTLGSVPERLQRGGARFAPNGFEDPFNGRFAQGLGGLGNPELEKELLEQLEKAFGGGAGGFKQLKLDLGADLLDGEDMKLGLQGIGSMRLEDDQGSVELKMKNGKRELRITDKEGKLLYEGPYDNDIDKAAVPEAFRERVEGLGVGKGGGGFFQFKMNNRRVLPKNGDE